MYVLSMTDALSALLPLCDLDVSAVPKWSKHVKDNCTQAAPEFCSEEGSMWGARSSSLSPPHLKTKFQPELLVSSAII